ncbi:hypothetical protein D918_00861 [Trichuris suis]|nr:hypothetical protein D918_00861 [Trichuris suis]
MVNIRLIDFTTTLLKRRVTILQQRNRSDEGIKRYAPKGMAHSSKLCTDCFLCSRLQNESNSFLLRFAEDGNSNQLGCTFR